MPTCNKLFSAVGFGGINTPSRAIESLVWSPTVSVSLPIRCLGKYIQESLIPFQVPSGLIRHETSASAKMCSSSCLYSKES
ncbi:hypothetical protein PVAG01_01878 [Phlyctema vagabunda]|uniref:Uncharacterized protein n=1 Tax=Phlyctema vagabunda TaxID=108571 RepID=A0ABR4PYA6_9HELO